MSIRLRTIPLRTAWLGYSAEWTAGLRNHPAAAAALWLGCTGCALIPGAGFPALGLVALLCTGLYRCNEPLALLQSPRRGGARLMASKIFTAWRNYLLSAAVPALLSIAAAPRYAWMGAVWLPLSMLLFVYAVAAKYTFYDPQIPSAPLPAATRAGFAGFAVPLLLPLTLWLTVSYAVRAERNLNRYLHDYA